MTTPTTPQPTAPAQADPARSFPMQAASLSVLAPLAAVWIIALCGSPAGWDEGVFIALVNTAGLAFGIAAVVSARRRGGRLGVYVRASIGICMCALVVFFTVKGICVGSGLESRPRIHHAP